MNFGNDIQAGTRFISSEMQDLLERIIFLIPNWKWLALIAGFIALYFIRMLALGLFRKIRQTQSYFPDKSFMMFLFQLDLEKAASWILTAFLGLVFSQTLLLSDHIEKYFTFFFKIIIATNLIRICYLAVEALGASIKEWAKKTHSQIDDQLAPLATKTLKVLVIIVGVLIVLQNFGVDVTALLAGLGIGGVALAFAAQDTVANVFGTITILLDSPFKLGDKIKLGDTEGIVEEVGFRSTRIRTYYNSLVTLPNSVVAKERIDNLSDRKGWIRFRQTLGFTYEAKTEQINQFLENLKYRLLQDSTIDRERISLSFNNFGESSLNVLINFHYQITPEEDESIRNQAYLQEIHMLVNQFKLEFAFPTQTIYLQQVKQI